MDVQTLLAYLLGSRPAIERLVADPWAPWVGLALVASAGLARSYTTRDVIREWWHLLLPAAAALGVSVALYTVLVARLEIPPDTPGGFRSVAALVLLTAPLAWLYAIPFHHFLPWPHAVRARLLTLGLVATWRVVLLVRAVALLLDDGVLLAVCVVLLVCDGIALLGLYLTRTREPSGAGQSTPILLELMSGIQPPGTPSAESRLTANVTTTVAVAGILSLPLWLLGMVLRDVSGATWTRLLAVPADSVPPSPGVWAVAGLPLGGFVLLLPWTQRAPRLARRVEEQWRKGKLVAMVELLASHGPRDFPPGWLPPPLAHFRDPPTLLDVLEQTLTPDRPPWLREVYLQRLRFYLSEPLWFWFYDQDLEQLAGLLARLPEGPTLARQLLAAARSLEEFLNRYPHHFLDERQREGDDAALRRLALMPEPQPTGRRGEIVAAIERLACHAPTAGEAS